MDHHRKRFGLVMLGIVSVLIYDYAFSQPYNLVFLLRSSAPPDLGFLTGYAGHAAAFYVGAVSLLFALYLGAVHLASRIESSSSWKWVLALGIAMGLVLIRTYPYAASDLFLYVARGRALGVYGYSSMELAPSQFPVSGYVPFASEWLNTASPYGPLWEWLAAFLARLGHGSPLGSLLLFKGFILICYAGCGWLVYHTMLARQEGNALAGLIAFAWNPLVLLEGLANGHNDLAMLFFVALAFWCWQKQRHTEFLLALVCGGLVKYVPLLLLPVALIALYRRVGLRAWLRVSLSAGALSLVLIGVTLIPLWPGWRNWSLSGQMQQGHNSVFVWLVLVLERVCDLDTAYWVSSLGTRVAFAGGYLWLLVSAWRRRRVLIETSYLVLLLYLVVGSGSFGYWYIAWLCLLAPFVANYQQRLWTLILSWCGLMSVPLYNFMGAFVATRWPSLDIHLIAVPLIFLLPFVLSPWAATILPPALNTARRGGSAWARLR